VGVAVEVGVGVLLKSRRRLHRKKLHQKRLHRKKPHQKCRLLKR